MIPYGRQAISQEDIDTVVSVLRSDFLTQGPAVPRFEQAVAEYCGVRHAVAMNSATSALHVACLALGLAPGDWLWTSPITFVASANCALYCSAKVDFVDIDPQTLNISPVALEAKLIAAQQAGCLPKIVVAVHMAGHPCDMEAIRSLGIQYRFAVIEDAAHAIGAWRDGKPVGSCQHSDITVFSFHPVKIITSAEGGMAVTNNPDLAERMDLLRSHGITRDPIKMTEASHGPWYYQQVALGFNYRITDLQAALGASQMSRLDAFVSRRHELFCAYNEAFTGLPLTLPVEETGCVSSHHLYIVKLRQGATHNLRLNVFNQLRELGIGVNLHYIPVHLQPEYRRLGFGPGDFPVSEAYYAQAITLPLFAAMTECQQQHVISCLQGVLA